MVYCGNNKLNQKSQRLGTRYECLQKGIGIGSRLPRERYEPIETIERKIYCGKSNRLPQNYDEFGTRVECLHKGVGIGKRM